MPQQADEASSLDNTPKLLLIPKKAKFKGRTVLAPQVTPILAPLIDHKGTTVGFYTKAAPNLSMTRSITPGITPRIDDRVLGKKNATDRGGAYRKYEEL
jgi:hypothetical protein